MAIIKETSDFKSHIWYTLYRPENGTVKSTLVIIHGMQEHSGRYALLARYMAERGVAVLAYDHPGHGKTAASQEDLGFFRENHPADYVVQCARKMSQYIEDLYPDVPHFILGHSMGSFITRCLLQTDSARFQGAIITGTGHKIPGSKLAKSLLSLINRISPRNKSGVFNGLFSQSNNSRFKNDEDFDSTSWLSLSQTNRSNFKNDALNGQPFSYNGYYGLVTLHVRATARYWSKDISLDFPLIFISGEDDPIGNYGKGVKKIVENLKSDGFHDVTIKLYPKMRHEILNEDIQEEVFDMIYQWMMSRIE